MAAEQSKLSEPQRASRSNTEADNLDPEANNTNTNITMRSLHCQQWDHVT